VHDLVPDFTGPEGSFFLFLGGRPGIFFTLGGKALDLETHASRVAGHANMSSCIAQSTNTNVRNC
jgi:hypothetical protein